MLPYLKPKKFSVLKKPKNLPFRTGELSLEEIKEQKDISNMTIKMSDLQARSTPPEDLPSDVQNPPSNVQNPPPNVPNLPSNVQNPPSNVQNSQKDEEGEKSSKIESTSISSKSSLLEDSQRFAFLSNTKALVFTTYKILIVTLSDLVEIPTAPQQS